MEKNEETTVFTGTTLERHNNRIKTEVLNQVIEKLNKHMPSHFDYGAGYNDAIEDFTKIVQSLLPKEEAKDWSKASDEKLKKEAEKLIGKTIVCLVDNKPHVVKQHYNNDPNNTRSDGSIWMDSETLIGSTNEQMGIQVYCRESNQWAEIIPDSQIKEPVIHEVKSEPTQEIKTGDEVIYNKSGKQNKVVSIDGGIAWIKAEENDFGILVYLHNLSKVQLQKT